jgi:cyclase
MLKKRIIPTLLLKGSGLYKTTKFKNPVYLGDAINVAKIFNEKHVDELFVFDITASKENREPNYELIKSITSSCFMPVGYGGGVNSMEIAKKLFSIGVEKISLNTSALKNPELIKSLANTFGNQSIIVSLNIQRNWLGKVNIVDNQLKKIEIKDIVKFIKHFEFLGAGEIFINDVDNEGTMKGYDLNFIQAIASALNVPLIACGGAGSKDDIKILLQETKVSAAAAGSIFVYSGPRKAVLISYIDPSELKEIL